MTPARWLVLLGSIVLFCAGLLHLLGYPHIFPVLHAAGLNPQLIGALLALWASFSVQFVVLSSALVWISWRPRARTLLLFLALVPAANAALMYHFIGPFIGAHMVLGGTVLLVAGAWMMPRDQAV